MESQAGMGLLLSVCLPTAESRKEYRMGKQNIVSTVLTAMLFVAFSLAAAAQATDNAASSCSSRLAFRITDVTAIGMVLTDFGRTASSPKSAFK
jgi:hypothetical protein